MRFYILFVLLALNIDVIADEKSQVLVSSKSPPLLVELYSSQGCSSCPPAQQWVNSFMNTETLWEDVIPMVFHVDYWDYLGWRDPFASSKYSQRQRQHYHLGNINSVYTPGFVVDGREWTGWFAGQPITEKKHRVDQSTSVLKATASKRGISVQYFDEQDDVLHADIINIAVLGFGAQTPVKRGENANRVLVEDFIVLGFESFDYKAGKTFSWPKLLAHTEVNAVVVWMSDKNQLTPKHAVAGFLNDGLLDN